MRGSRDVNKEGPRKFWIPKTHVELTNRSLTDRGGIYLVEVAADTLRHCVKLPT